MDKTELNMNVLNKVIAFKMLEILRNNGIIDDSKYVNIERKRKQYGESIKTQNKLYPIIQKACKEGKVTIEIV